MSAPRGSQGSIGPVNISQPSETQSQKDTKQGSSQRSVSQAQPSQDHSVSQGQGGENNSANDTKDVSQRQTQPTRQPQTEAEMRLENAKGQLTNVMSKLWLRDQLQITRELASLTPEQADILANKLQIVIKIQMPDSDEVVQLIPRLEGKGGVGRDHEPEGYRFLSTHCEALYNRLNAHAKPSDIYDQYVVYRNEVFKWGREVATAKGELFDYERDVYVKMVVSAFNHETTEKGVSFKFFRGGPDTSQYKDPGDLSTPPLQKKKKKKSKKNKQPQLEFRINADEDEIRKHAGSISDAESQASNGSSSYHTSPEANSQNNNGQSN
ncbi:hypothetical protein [Sansalvadorimonas verongulae]|uniref:hypothetical protein n=1 Tax=Sansalvadorimonas verongulae TaxID=2172824 RepID=UPI0012BD0810|nr:hypothetical protein [Sansalvadorimonas verongulae]MTI12076.1 hypothetical protein [Sansalvadorimonas verongulae]